MKPPTGYGNPNATPLLAAAYPNSPRRLGVLVADDEEFIRRLLSALLVGQGLAVWLAGCGRDALDLYKLHAAEIDAVILDVHMPGLDGPQTLAALRGFTPSLRACFLTGDPAPYSEDQLRDAGADAILWKTGRLDEIVRVVLTLAKGDANGIGPPGGPRAGGKDA